jgi:hypothetical protein
MAMTEDELNAQVEAELNAKIEAELRAERERKRAEIAARLRREAAMAHLDRVNARHPIESPLAGLTPEQHKARLKAMDAAAKAAYERMDAVNRRPVEGSLAHQRAQAALPGTGGEGLRIK